MTCVGVDTRSDPLRTYPAGDVAANLIGFMKDNGKPAGGLERNFDTLLAGKNGKETYEVGGGNRIPLGDNSEVKPVNGKDLRLTIDRDVQWYSQRVLREAVQKAKAKSGTAVVLDSRTGELLAFADYPTFDANRPNKAPKTALGSSGLSDVYEPGSVEKVLTVSGLLDAGKVTQTTRIKVPSELPVLDRTIGDWFDHGLIRFTMAGVIARSSNIGTALAAMQFTPQQLWSYLDKFGLGRRTDVGMPGETRGLLPSGRHLVDPDPRAGGLRPGPVGQRAPDGRRGQRAGQRRRGGQPEPGPRARDHGRRPRGRHGDHDEAPAVSAEAARKTAEMMELVTTQDVGTAPGAGIKGYRVAGKTGTAQEVGGKCNCYADGGLAVSFAGFAPADKPRFTVYVVIKKPQARCLRRRHRRPGLPQDPELRHAEVRRRADRDDAAEHPDPVGTVRRSRRCPRRLD